MTAIRLENVALTLGDKHFFFDTEIASGAITAVTGASGSGKSTLLNLIAGFETPDKAFPGKMGTGFPFGNATKNSMGRILVDGKDISRLHPAERPVSLVFQDNNLFGHLDLLTNIGLGISPSLKLSAADRDRISAALTRVGLGGFEKRLPPTLSGGERQRAAFARALVRNRPLLLLDEPFAALDPGLRGAMAALLCDLHRESGNTVLIVTHDPDEVARLADHALFIEDGRILVAAPVAEFLQRRDSPGLAAFLGANPV